MTSEQAEKLSSLVIRYATLRDEMYHAVKVDDPKRLDRAVLKFREATDLLWDLGHELMEEMEITPLMNRSA